MAISKNILWAALCLGVTTGAPQNFVRLLPADFSGQGFRAIQAGDLGSHALHTINQDAPVFTRLVQTSDGLAHIGHADEAQFVQASPFATRLVQHTPALTRIVPAAPAVTTVVQAAPTAVRTIVQDVEAETVDPNPQYNFGYSVADTVTGDSKSREEQRDGDVVTGSYTVADPDGRIRHVAYTADSVNGFQAKVTYDGKEGPVAIPFEGGAPLQSAVSTVAGSNDDAVSIVNARQNQILVQQAAATPTFVRTVPQSVGASTLVRNSDGSHAFHRVSAAQQPQLFQIGSGAQTPTLIRNFDGLVGAQQNQLVQIQGSDQTFQLSPFGLENLSLDARFANQSPFLVQSPNGQFIRA